MCKLLTTSLAHGQGSVFLMMVTMAMWLSES